MQLRWSRVLTRSCAVLAVVATLACGGREAASQSTLEDGFYVVLREEESAAQEGEAVAVYDGTGLVVHPTPDVPLKLAAAPRREKVDGGTSRILLQLAPQSAAALERVSRENVGGQAVVILGGEAVSRHKIRGAISGGHLTISCCDTQQGNYLWERLKRVSPNQP
jgi:hypothetical protein